MDYYSIWPFFACMALLLALVATPAFAAADATPRNIVVQPDSPGSRQM